MKYKATRKAVKEGYAHVFYTGYCGLTEALSNIAPVAYTTGANGWNADVYDFGPYAIVTGYRPFGDIRLPEDMRSALNTVCAGKSAMERRDIVFKALQGLCIKHA